MDWGFFIYKEKYLFARQRDNLGVSVYFLTGCSLAK